jgi:hypothetical protein
VASCLLVVAALALGLLGLDAASASAAGRPTCSGTPESPGVLAGRFRGPVEVEGTCFVNGGRAIVEGTLRLGPGSVLVAAFGNSTRTPGANSDLIVQGNLRVNQGATLIAGCLPSSFPCLDDPNPSKPTLSGKVRVTGTLFGEEPLGVVIHNGKLDGLVTVRGGGGGETCVPGGPFAEILGSPTFTAFEDTSFGSQLTITGVHSCWMGVIRDRVTGNAAITENQLADPDAIEILANTFVENLNCRGNSMVWNSSETGEGLFPRLEQPNRVRGMRKGDCRFASPTEPGGPLGPGPF